MERNDFWLQPLRIPEGWEVWYNQFYEIDPAPDSMNYFDSPTLLSLGHHRANLHLDMSWKPEYDPKGQFELYIYPVIDIFDESTKKPVSMTLWEQPLLEYYSHDRKALVEKIECCLVAFEPYKDPRFLKNSGETDEPSESLRLRMLEEGLTMSVFEEILNKGNKRLQLMVIDHKEVTPKMLEIMSEKADKKGHRKKATIILHSKKFRKKHGLE